MQLGISFCSLNHMWRFNLQLIWPGHKWNQYYYHLFHSLSYVCIWIGEFNFQSPSMCSFFLPGNPVKFLVSGEGPVRWRQTPWEAWTNSHCSSTKEDERVDSNWHKGPVQHIVWWTFLHPPPSQVCHLSHCVEITLEKTKTKQNKWTYNSHGVDLPDFVFHRSTDI